VNPEDLALLDKFLHHWDSFAQGRQDPSYIKAHYQEFYDSLVSALEAGDAHAMPRCALFFFVQVFLFLPEDSKLYRVLQEVTDGALRARVIKEKGKFLDSSQMWTWWQQHSAEYPTYDLLNEWMTRPFTRETVVPQYERLSRAS
jgi:hypothetical protein